MEVNMPMSTESSHVQVQHALDMVAQHGNVLTQMQGSNDSRPTHNATHIAPVAPAMAAAAGIHEPAALADDASGASGATLFDLSVSPSDTRRTVGSSSGRAPRLTMG